MLSDHTMREIYKDYNTLNTKQKEIVKNIAKKFPYSINDVTNVYVSNGYSEYKTRNLLMNKLIRGE